MRHSDHLSATIAHHIAVMPSGLLPESAMHAARRSLLDGLGVILAASGLSIEARPFSALAADVSGPSSLLGRGCGSTPALAALANGALSHALDFEDAFDRAPCHPNAALLPALLAVAEARQSVSGGDLLAAIAIGCDLVCRMGLSLRQPMEAGGWYPPPILGGFGAVAAVARISGLDAGQVADAFSLMLCQTGCPGEIKYDADTVLRAVREAFPAQTAVLVCDLARRGVRGFAAPLEGRAGFYALYAGDAYAPEDLIDGLGERFWIDQLSFKRWPACRGTHPHIEAVRAIATRRAIVPDDIAEIHLMIGPIQRMLLEPLARKTAPVTVIDAKFSLPFTVATAIVQGDVTLDSFAPAGLADPVVRALAERVRFTEQSDWGHHRAASGAVELRLHNGERLAASIDVAAGAPESPLSDDNLVAKFVDCAGRAAMPIKAARAGHLARAILAMRSEDDVLVVLAPLLCKRLHN